MSTETGITYFYGISLAALLILIGWGTWEQLPYYNRSFVLTMVVGFIVRSGVNAILLFAFGTVFGKVLMTFVAMAIGVLVFIGWLIFEDYRVKTFYRPIHVGNGG